jgi:hypothetical protein
MSTTKIARFLTAYAVAAALLAITGGCASRGDAESAPSDGRRAETFRPAAETTDVARISEQQIAAGARTDATLRPYHFYDAELNSLGLEKLDHMFSGAPRTGALVVYLDIPSADEHKALADARRKAVGEYLAGRGMARGAFRVVTGHNPNATVPARSLPPGEGAAMPETPAGFGGGGASGGGFGEPTK